MSEPNLFGDPSKPPSKARYKPTERRGYAYFPGTGPKGETCGSCKHIRGKRYKKCAVYAQTKKVTHGMGTDILSRSPACKYWEKKDA